MKSSFYLKHDLDAREDDKMRALMMKLGARGYGIYWMVAEDLYRSAGRIARDYSALSWAYHEPKKDVEAVVESFGLFYFDEGKIACRRVDRDLNERRSLAEEGRSAILRRKRKDGSSWVKDRDLVGDNKDTYTRRGEDRTGEEGEERKETAAPSAADLCGQVDKSVDKYLRKTDEQLLELQVPFSFGDIPKGRRVIDIDPASASEMLAKVPRLGLDLRRALTHRIKIKTDELHQKLRR